MWTIEINYEGKQTTYQMEDLSKQYEIYGFHWVEDYINEELYDLLENHLGILDEVNADNGEYLDYTVYDQHGKSFEDYEC